MNLTAFGVVALVAAALLGIAGQWSPAVGVVPWWRLVVGALVIGLLIELAAARRHRLSARWLDADRLYLGRSQALEVELRDESGRASTVQMFPSVPGALDPADASVRTLRLPAEGASRAVVTVTPVQLGVHEWPTLPVRLLGPFQLAWWSRRVTAPGRTAVLPDTLGRRAVAAGSAETGSVIESRIGAGLELNRLREYRPGDPRRAIDWKASARTSRLITRVFSEEQHVEIMVLLDAGRTSRTEFDGMSQLGHYVNLAARFAEYCAGGDDRVGLVAFADRPLCVVPPGRGLRATTRIRRALADLEPQAVESDALEAALLVSRLVRHRCLVIVLTDLYESSSSGRLTRTARLLAPKHLPLMVGLLGDEVGSLAAAEARQWLDPYLGLAAREYQRQVRANAARLGQLGALAMATRATDLERKVLGRYRTLRAQHRI